METNLNNCNSDISTTGNTISLDYLYGQGEDMRSYQIVRFSNGAPWQVVDQDIVIASLDKKNGFWRELGSSNLSIQQLSDIGKFIDKQHFNFLPGKIKKHWFETVEEVIMLNDSEYMVVTKAGVDFRVFRNMFSSFISHLIEEEWLIEFKVYNADFTADFLVKVF